MTANIVKTAVFVFVCVGIVCAGLWLYRKTVKNREAQVPSSAEAQNYADPSEPFPAKDTPKTEVALKPPPVKKISPVKSPEVKNTAVKQSKPAEDSEKSTETENIKTMPEQKDFPEIASAAEQVKPADNSEHSAPVRSDKIVQDAPVFFLPGGKPKDLIWSLAFFTEANMNSPVNPAFGTGLYALFVLPFDIKIGSFSAGAKALYSYDFNKHHLYDAALLFRWTFYDFAAKPSKDSGFFIQAEGGAVFGQNNKTADSKLWIFGLGQASFGYRLMINNFFIEPYIRGGYPIAWAVGLTGGIRI